jgi:hypothetical protein
MPSPTATTATAHHPITMHAFRLRLQGRHHGHTPSSIKPTAQNLYKHIKAYTSIRDVDVDVEIAARARLLAKVLDSHRQKFGVQGMCLISPCYIHIVVFLSLYTSLPLCTDNSCIVNFIEKAGTALQAFEFAESQGSADAEDLGVALTYSRAQLLDNGENGVYYRLLKEDYTKFQDVVDTLFHAYCSTRETARSGTLNYICSFFFTASQQQYR